MASANGVPKSISTCHEQFNQYACLKTEYSKLHGLLISIKIFSDFFQ